MTPHGESLPTIWQKRVFDFLASFILLIILSPLFLSFLTLIFLEHLLRGHPFDPLFYSEYRVSRGKLFKIYKFNIFNQRVIDTYRREGKFIHTKVLEKNGGLTLVGMFLKQIYLDELPQLYNVLRGEMSLVGPRPLNREVFAQVAARGIPAQAIILGGMTGNFQSLKDTRGRSAATLEQEYLHICRSKGGWQVVLTDIQILLRTLKVLLRAKGV